MLKYSNQCVFNKTLELNSLHYQACVVKVLKKSFGAVLEIFEKALKVENLPKITFIVTV